MKNKIYLIITCLSFFCFSENTFAQEKAKTEITSVIQNAQTVEFAIESTTPFYYGGNVHILHIGNKDFKMYKQTKRDGKGQLTFLIQISEWNTLVNGDDVWVSYGNIFKTSPDQNIDIKALCEKAPQKCWYLGKFSSARLKK
jgi:hypothetical protein